MDKLTRQREIVKFIATEPWQHTCTSLAKTLGVNQITIQRDMDEMKDNGYEFKHNEQAALYLQAGGWNGILPVKASTLRQMEILRMLMATPQGVFGPEIYRRFNRRDQEEVSYKTLERALKDLEKKNLIKHRDDVYAIRPEYILPPLQLEEREKTLLLEALKVAQALAPIPEEIRALEAKLKLWMGDNNGSREILFVHGRTPTQDVHRSQCCFQLEEAARAKNVVEILYRKAEESVRQIRLHPLGIVYYWVLDNWYLIAQDDQDQMIKTYLVNRILEVTRLEQTYSPVEGFNLRSWYQYAWGVYRDHSPVSVIIRFHNYYSTFNRVQTELAKRKTCTLTEDGDDLIMRDYVEGLDELAVWLRGFGAGAEVIEPLELKEKVSGEFGRLLRLYGGGSVGLD